MTKDVQRKRVATADPKIEEEIRQRAYELYRKRGGFGGNPADDWMQATKDVLSRKAKAGSTSP